MLRSPFFVVIYLQHRRPIGSEVQCPDILESTKFIEQCTELVWRAWGSFCIIYKSSLHCIKKEEKRVNPIISLPYVQRQFYIGAGSLYPPYFSSAGPPPSFLAGLLNDSRWGAGQSYRLGHSPSFIFLEMPLLISITFCPHSHSYLSSEWAFVLCIHLAHHNQSSQYDEDLDMISIVL